MEAVVSNLIVNGFPFLFLSFLSVLCYHYDSLLNNYSQVSERTGSPDLLLRFSSRNKLCTLCQVYILRSKPEG